MEVHACLRTQPTTISVRGEAVEYVETIAVCPTCGAVIGDAHIEGANLERAYARYRLRHGIMAPDEIKALRTSYGLSLREFSRFLGFGEQTAYRYEHGDIPDQTHANTLRSANTIDGARLLLSQNRARLTARSIARIEQHIRSMEAGAAEGLRLHLTLEEREANAPSSANGYRHLSVERVFALVFLLAGKCRELYWTKLQKAMFFADMANFERSGQSLTGLTYAHATYGPVIDCKEEVRFILAERGVVDFRELGYGEILVPLSYGVMPFSEEELSLINEIAEFVNTFTTASELSSYFHNLSCWTNTVDGQTIKYTDNSGEVIRAVSNRMRNVRSA